MLTSSPKTWYCWWFQNLICLPNLSKWASNSYARLPIYYCHLGIYQASQICHVQNSAPFYISLSVVEHHRFYPVASHHIKEINPRRWSIRSFMIWLLPHWLISCYPLPNAFCSSSAGLLADPWEASGAPASAPLHLLFLHLGTLFSQHLPGCLSHFS